jgi:hypothetical protein
MPMPLCDERATDLCRVVSIPRSDLGGARRCRSCAPRRSDLVEQSGNFADLSYCERQHIAREDCVDGDLFLSPNSSLLLWPVTALVTFIVCLSAALTGPSTVRERAVWATLIACSVFVANRNNLIWAFLVTAAGLCIVMFLTDELPSSQRRWSSLLRRRVQGIARADHERER